MKILFMIGTRPEAIKVLPVYKEFKKYYNSVKLCNTQQHKSLTEEVLELFEEKADFNLNVMRDNQTLEELSSNILIKVSKIIKDFDLVFVQGDTTTAFIASLASFYQKVPVAHLEAGLRSFNNYSPFPEEMNRKLISQIASYHFAPTKESKINLENEGVKDNIYVVGNSGIDALFYTLSKVGEIKEKNQILVTIHRRENFNKLDEIFLALRELALKYESITFLYPLHPNPNVKSKAFEMLENIKNFNLIPPLNYLNLLKEMKSSIFIISDSGGIQEEAPALGKKVFVLRDESERIEGVKAGCLELVGTKRENILKSISNAIENGVELNCKNPYGDGKTSRRVLEIIRRVFETKGV